MAQVGESATQNWVLTWARKKSNKAESKVTDNQKMGLLNDLEERRCVYEED